MDLDFVPSSLDFLQCGLEFLQPGLEFVPGGLLRADPGAAFRSCRERGDSLPDRDGRIAESVLSAILPIVDEFAHNRGIRQSRGVSERTVFVLCDLAQDAAHDLARTGLWKAGRELDEVRRR